MDIFVKKSNARIASITEQVADYARFVVVIHEQSISTGVLVCGDSANRAAAILVLSHGFEFAQTQAVVETQLIGEEVCFSPKGALPYSLCDEIVILSFPLPLLFQAFMSGNGAFLPTQSVSGIPVLLQPATFCLLDFVWIPHCPSSG
jgi:hypothetical protein